MMTAIHQPVRPAEPPIAGYTVPGPRSTDAIGIALRGVYGEGGSLPEAIAAAMLALDRVDRA